MALTKVTGQVINTSTDVTVGVLTVTNTLAVGGTVSIGGTLTYEDVTNIDSVGLITARNGIIVGSGITLSKDGDGFFTGVVTATSYAGSGANLTGIDTDLVSDTSPQLGGNLDVNTKNIVFGDSGGATDDRLTFGAGTDLSIYHDGSNSYISNGTNNLIIKDTTGDDTKGVYIQSSLISFQDETTNEQIAKFTGDGSVELYYNNTKRFETLNGGTKVYGNLTFADDLNTIRLNDNYKILLGTSQDLKLYHDGSNSLVNADGTGNLILQGANDIILRPADGEVGIDINANGAVDLYYDNSKKFETSSTGNQGTGVLKLISGNGSTSSDDNILHIVSGGTATRGIKLGTGRATGSAQNDGMGYIDAIDSESSGYGAQIQLRVNASRIINVGYQANKYVGINEDDPGYELVVAAQDANESTLQIKAGGNGKESNILFGAPDDADVGKISYDHNGDHMKFITGTTERFRVNSNGICLGGTGSANGLDDYEEGTWTPSFSGDINFSTKYNFTYTKIGRIVHITGYLHQRSGSFSATWQITNLPFAGSGNYNMAPLWSHGVDLAFMAYIADSSTNLNIRDRDGATAQPNELSIQMTYITST